MLPKHLRKLIYLYQNSNELYQQAEITLRRECWTYQAFYQNESLALSSNSNDCQKQIRGYLVYNDITHHLYIIFFGTRTKRDIMYDMLFQLIPLGLSEARQIKVHAGFRYLTNQCFVGLNRLIRQFQFHHIYLMGHSLGAAMAILTSILWGKSKHPISQSCYQAIREINLFCSPRIGNQAFNNWYEQFATKWTTIVIRNNYDIITKLPPLFLGYRSLSGDKDYLCKPEKCLLKHQLPLQKCHYRSLLCRE